ncbi:hypothetical protein BpHYR1_036337 [Brachionus plicatilis]|uniref:Uncharacterized protein n=1 Tax=Brachionus plicatilis TaxID=10195 RepID=A0A3M7QHE4_BRAPC|nr:hypothetical protein BpHYR1_036337 [Brachionus plicatilis]
MESFYQNEKKTKKKIRSKIIPLNLIEIEYFVYDIFPQAKNKHKIVFQDSNNSTAILDKQHSKNNQNLNLISHIISTKRFNLMKQNLLNIHLKFKSNIYKFNRKLHYTLKL